MPHPDSIAALDRTDPEGAIAAAAKRCSNWGRWGADDVLGTLNFLDDGQAAGGRRAGPPRRELLARAELRRRRPAEGLAAAHQPGAHHAGHRRRTPSAAPRASRTGSAAPTTWSSCRCRPRPSGTAWATSSTTARAYNGRRAGDVVTSEGDRVTGIETTAGLIAGRGVLLDVGRRGRRPTASCPTGSPSPPSTCEATIAAQGDSARVGRGDLLLVRTGRLARARREGWGDYAGGASPGLSFTTADWLHDTEIAGIATDTWGFEVRPNEFDVAFQPLHQVAIPHIGLFLGEMWDLDALAADCAADGVCDFLLTAAPLPVTGAVGAPVNPIAVK